VSPYLSYCDYLPLNLMIVALLRARDIYQPRSYTSSSQAHAKPPLYGQPLSQTHPHLIKSPSQLTRGITEHEYEQRRRNLMQSLPEGSKVVCMGGTVRLVTQREYKPICLEIRYSQEAYGLDNAWNASIEIL
jgi:hypothetical protein